MWLPLSLFSYFFSAISLLTDRFLLIGSLKNPHLYAFFTGIWGIGAVAVLPFGIIYAPFELVMLGLLGGFIGTYGILAFFVLVRDVEITRSAPIVGTAQILFTPFLSFLFLGEHMMFSMADIAAFAFFLVGSIFMMQKHISFSFPKADWVLIGVASFLITLSLIIAKIVFIQLVFVQGFILASLGGGIGAFTLLAFQETRQGVFHRTKDFGNGDIFLPLVGGRIASVLAGVIYWLAVFFAPVPKLSIISAMLGIQYIFLYIGAYIIERYSPHLLKERLSGLALIQKIIAGSLIILGLVLVTLF